MRDVVLVVITRCAMALTLLLLAAAPVNVFAHSADAARVGAALSGAQKGALLRAATQPFKDTAMTQAGRALTKHPELVGLSKETLNQSLRSPAAINAAAEGALGGILQSGTAVSRTAGRFGQVLDVTGEADSEQDSWRLATSSVF